jgi:hypothetical protein
MKKVTFRAELSATKNGWCVYREIQDEDAEHFYMFESGPYSNFGQAEAEAAQLNQREYSEL